MREVLRRELVVGDDNAGHVGRSTARWSEVSLFFRNAILDLTVKCTLLGEDLERIHRSW